MNLVLDIGNTRIKTAIFKGKEILHQAVWTDFSLPDLAAFMENKPVNAAIISNVAEPKQEITDFLQQKMPVFELNAQNALPIKNLYKTPETLGKDRLAAVVGAFSIFGAQACLVVDFGTCIKFDFLNEKSEYLGGNIAPGAAMRIKAMHHFTARLPEVPMQIPKSAIGTSTETALQNGALRGVLMEIKGYATMFKKKWPNGQVILTGGDADFFYKHMKIKNLFIEKNLVLHGLNCLLNNLT